MSSRRKNIEKLNKEYWDEFADKTGKFITARQITVYIVFIAAIVFIPPSNSAPII